MEYNDNPITLGRVAIGGGQRLPFLMPSLTSTNLPPLYLYIPDVENSGTRVLARNLDMSVQNSNSKTFACPDLATNILQILKLTTFNNLLNQKGQSHFPEDGLLEYYLVITSKKLKLKILHRNYCLSKKEFFGKLPVQKTGWTGLG